jgi:hypothetical protein
VNACGAVELLVASVAHALYNDLLKARLNSGPLLRAERFSRLGLMVFVTTLLAPSPYSFLDSSGEIWEKPAGRYFFPIKLITYPFIFLWGVTLEKAAHRAGEI